MMVRPRGFVYCHRPSSAANVLAAALREENVRATRIYGIRAPRDVSIPIINWGCTSLHFPPQGILFNHPDKVVNSVSKIKTAAILKEADVPCINITTSEQQARIWLSKNYQVFARRDGLSNGRGIVMFQSDWALAPRADFFAKVFKKTHEFRVHVVGSHAIDLVQKKTRVGHYDDNRFIRTHSNGWVFSHDGIVLGDQRDIDTLLGLATEAVKALGLDFGAVDILAIVDEATPRRLRKAVVCEVNTAPGLEDTRTIRAYADNMKKLLTI